MLKQGDALLIPFQVSSYHSKVLRKLSHAHLMLLLRMKPSEFHALPPDDLWEAVIKFNEALESQ